MTELLFAVVLTASYEARLTAMYYGWMRGDPKLYSRAHHVRALEMHRSIRRIVA